MTEKDLAKSKGAKPWPCHHCGNVLGYAVYGQLYVDGDARFNTDGTSVIMYCKECGARKTWYTNDRLSRLVVELADALAKRLSGDS